MKTCKKIVVLCIALVVLLGNFAFASEFSDVLLEYNYTDEFNEWLNRPEKEREKSYMPRPFAVLRAKSKSQNPIKLTQNLGNSLIAKFSLRDLIPENLVVRNQGQTNGCWAFSSVASYESNLALKNYYDENPVKVYDFSEKHLLYATTRTFKNGEISKYGIDRKVDDGGNYLVSSSYYTSQLGPVNESDMPYSAEFPTLSLSEVFEKKQVAKLYDYVFFPSYDVTTDDLTEIKNLIKNHVKKYGGVEAGIYGAQPESEFYNNDTGAMYCDDGKKYPFDHDVLIIGWDDNYSKENFNEAHRPSQNGAWIVKNSWGTRINEYTYGEMRDALINELSQDVLDYYNWKKASDIPDAGVEYYFEQLGYEVDKENKVGYQKFGDDGFMYISYQDANVYLMLGAVENASEMINHDYVYQYDYAPSGGGLIGLDKPEAYIGNIFEKQSSGIELLNEVAITVDESMECTVYVNPKNSSMVAGDLQQVKLKSGNSEIIEAGYHTLEFAEPVKITGDEFVVVLYLRSKVSNDSIRIITEAAVAIEGFRNIEIESGKCFWATTDNFANGIWSDCSKLFEVSSGQLPNCDLTIKAFTTKYDGTSEEPETPTDTEDSDAIAIKFNGASAKVTAAKGFYFTDKTKKEYVLLDMAINSVERSLYNDSYEYYYYLSANSVENNISDDDWVKITEKQSTKNNLTFSVDTRKISNYSDLLKSDDLYIYIKEIVKKNGKTKTTVSNGLKVVNDVEAEVYKDNVKQKDNVVKDDTKGDTDNKNSSKTDNTTNTNTKTTNTTNTTTNTTNKTTNETNKNSTGSTTTNNSTKTTDDTTANKTLPHTGKNVTAFILVLTATIVGIVLYKKYEDIDS